jgi:hypothetical protein
LLLRASGSLRFGTDSVKRSKVEWECATRLTTYLARVNTVRFAFDHSEEFTASAISPPLSPQPSVCRQPLIETPNKSCKRNAKGTAERPQFDDINPALPSFAFADERLRLANSLCQPNLGKAASLADRAEFTKK